jgi:PKD repeat protein
VKTFKLTALGAIVSPFFFACGGDNLTLPSEGAPAHIQVVEETNGQSSSVNTPLPDSIKFLVTDTQNRPVPGATVSFVLEESGAGAGAVVDPASSTTNSSGEVSTSLTLGTQVGIVKGQAAVQVPEGSTPVSANFTAQALSSTASTLTLVSGNGQSASVGAELPAPLVVKVTDSFGNPIPGVEVQWAAEGGGDVSAATTTTGEDGQTSVTRTLGPAAGEQRTTATGQDLAGSPVTFTHTATAGNASSVNIVSGNNQEAPAGSKLAQPLVVRVLDQDGNPIPNLAVSWVVGDGGGTADPTTSNTGADGQASTQWTLGGTPGNNTLNAVVSGVGTATFKATATGTGAPSNLAIITQPPSSVTAGATLSPAPVVQVRDGAGHDLPAPGIEVVVSLTGGPGQLSGTTTVTTGANGQAQFSDLKITGATGSPKLIFSAEGLRSATSNKIQVEKAATTTAITADDPDPSDPNQSVTVSFTVTSGAGTPTGNVQVTTSGGGESCTASVSDGHCDIVLTHPGDQNLTATYQGDGVFASSSSASVPHHVNEPQNQAPVAVFSHESCVSGSPCQFTDVSTDADGSIVSWSWNFGDGTVSNEQNPSHSFFASIFPYHVTLTVTDNSGATNATAQDITVP